MTTHPVKSSGRSQCALIKRMLEARPGEWVSMPDLAEASDCYVVHSRINDLRKLGMNIQNKTERVGSKAFSFYMFTPTI